MANEPTLSEFTNIQADPERGTGTPAVFLDNSQTVRVLNENARFKAENDWKKYNMMLENFKDATKDLNEIAKMDIMSEDREALNKEFAEVFTEIGKNPRELFSGGPNMAKIQGRISALMSKATQSKMNNAFDMLNREFMLRNPHLNTDENKKRVEGYRSQQLGSRKAYTLDMPAIVDMGKLMTDVLGLPQVKQGVVSMGSDPSGKYLFEKSGHRYDLEQGRAIWNNALSTGVDENGKSYRSFAQQMFNQLTPDQQKYYKEKGDGDGAKALWADIYDRQVGTGKEIYSYDKGTIKTDSFAVEKDRAANALKLLKQKSINDLSLEAAKEGNREKLARLRATLRGQSAKQQKDWLDGATETIFTDAKAHGIPIYTVDPDGKTQRTLYKMEVSDPIRLAFGHKEKDGTKMVTVMPDEIYTDGEDRVITRYYKRDGGPSSAIKTDAHGDPIIDGEKSKQFSKNEFKAIYGKSVLGAKGLNDQIKAGAASDDDDDSDDGSDEPPIIKLNIPGF